jgi:hypothetical protein
MKKCIVSLMFIINLICAQTVTDSLCAHYHLSGNTVEITFTDITAAIQGTENGSVAYGDYDSDGDLDVLVTGDTGTGYISTIYRNDNGVFIGINAGLPGTAFGSAEWGDYDNDGDLDILLTGMTDSEIISAVYKNEGSGIFTDINAPLLGMRYGCATWGDNDNDGDLDILMSGEHDYSPELRLYSNLGDNTFAEIALFFSDAVPLFRNSSLKWTDYDKDSDLDIIITGATWDVENSFNYRNDGWIFTNIYAGLTGVCYSSVDCADYDSDGDTDIIITGSDFSSTVFTSKIYRNDGYDVFTDISAGLIGVHRGSGRWGDYDNDGDPDILISGSAGTTPITRLYRNEGSDVFSEAAVLVPGVTYGSASWFDHDNDNDLDIFLNGSTTSKSKVSGIYSNNTLIKNTKPLPPSVLNVNFTWQNTLATWSGATDAETPQPGLSYNIELMLNGKTIRTSSSDTANGYRRISGSGNLGQKLMSYNTLPLKFPLLPMEETKNIVTKIQSVDNCFAGSLFAVSDTTFVSDTLEVASKNIMLSSDHLSWEYVYPDSILNYQVQIDDNADFNSPLNETVSLSSKKITQNGKALFFDLALNELANFDSMVNNKIYYWRMKPVYKNSKRVTNFTVNPLSFIYDPVYSAPSPVSIAVEGNYVTLTWGTGKETEKGIFYNIYSSDDPYAVFPAGWTLVNSVTGTSYVLNSSVKKKFYCVTTAGTGK